MFPDESGPPPVGNGRWRGCHLASPLAYTGAGGVEVVASVSDQVAGLDPDTGLELWSVTLPAPDGEMGFVVGTPLLVEHRLFVSYHTTPASSGGRDVNVTRIRHRVVVVDLSARAIDDDFEIVELSGAVPATPTALDDGGTQDAGEVAFDPAHALGRAELVRIVESGDALGRLYVTFGNARDIQPWHGFAFELDLDAWLADGADAAVTALFVDTPESDCGPDGASGSRERICGGGLWAPSGPLVIPASSAPDEDEHALILASGNGQLDLSRGDYANTLMRTGVGLDFDPGCDPVLCEDFNLDGEAYGETDADHRACVESCLNLFVPRMPVGEVFQDLVSNDRCVGLSFFECWAKLDYIGGSTPALVDLSPDGGPRTLLYPTKDGSVYLVDADHLGTQYARHQLVPICGTATSSCIWDWAGMIVTEPVVRVIDGVAVALVATFMPDDEQPAGVFALEVTVDDVGMPQLSERWRFPEAGSAEATLRFRSHPTRIAAIDRPGQVPLAFLVDARGSGDRPAFVLDWSTGALVTSSTTWGQAYRFVEPLVVETPGDVRVYTPTCQSNAGDAWMEGFVLSTPAP